MQDLAGRAAGRVDELAADLSYDTILPGHGLPADPTVFPDMTAYLAAARELLGDDGEAYKQAILIDIANQYVFADRPA